MFCTERFRISPGADGSIREG